MSYFKNAVGYPNITDFINSEGHLEIGYTYETGIALLAFDEGGTVWEGKRSYDSLESALADAESGIGKWLKENG